MKQYEKCNSVGKRKFNSVIMDVIHYAEKDVLMVSEGVNADTLDQLLDDIFEPLTV